MKTLLLTDCIVVYLVNTSIFPRTINPDKSRYTLIQLGMDHFHYFLNAPLDMKMTTNKRKTKWSFF